jgi:hypothetical protein
MLAAVPLGILARRSGGGGGGLPGFVVLPFAVVGLAIVRRQPRNPIGSVLLLLTIAVAASADAGKWASMIYRGGYDLPLGRVAVFLAPGAWLWLIVLLPLPLALFPEGRLPRGWRRMLYAYLVFCAVVVAAIGWQDIVGVTARQLRIGSGGQLASFDSSAGNSNRDTAVRVIYLGFGLAWVLRLLLDFRRSTGDYRQQLKWLLTSGALGVAGLLIALTASSSSPVGGVGFGLGLFALPIGIGISILKYRLYDIDRLVSRTLSYLILTGLLVGGFVGLVVVITRVLPFSSPVAVAASTLTAAALFNPLRKRVQQLVDRRFNRARYDAEATVAAFRTRLRESVDRETVESELLEAAGRAVEPAHASLSLTQSQPERHA